MLLLFLGIFALTGPISFSLGSLVIQGVISWAFSSLALHHSKEKKEAFVLCDLTLLSIQQTLDVCS